MATTGRILVTGATGNTGPGLVSALCAAGADVRVLVRDEAKARPLQAMGAEVVVGDLDRPETLGPAIAGVAKVYLLTWNGPTQAQQVHDFIHAAKRVGAPHIVRHSMWGSPRSRIIQQGEQAEAEIVSSGLPWTLLKPTFFMQNTMMAAPTIANDGVIYWDLKDGRLGMIDVRDIIDVAVAVLTGDGHEGQGYVLTGPAAISFHDVAATFSAVLGRKITYVPVPGEAALQSMIGMGFPEWVSRGFVELSEGFSEGFASQITDNVATLTGHPARSFEQFARDHAGVFRGAAAA
jgi:uncharacterized protein YbjT (DUF2867 family)